MEYLLILVLQLLGISFHVMQKIVSIGDKFPAMQPSEVFKAFFKEDWDTLVVSGLVLMLNIVAQFIINTYKPPIVTWEYFVLTSYGLSLLFGYGGQRMIYKYFGTAERFLDKQVSDRLN